MDTMNAFSWNTRIKEIGGVDVRELVRRYGTPTYVYDASVIRRQMQKLSRFDAVRYAQKANSNLSILRLIKEQGGVVDAVSLGEIKRALTAGFSLTGEPPEIVYTADIFDRPTLQFVAENEVHCNLGSPDMIEQYGQVCPDRSITLRINPGFGHGHSQKTNTGGPSSKHGIWHESLDECLALAKRYRLSVSGLHMHIGSGTDFEHLAQVVDAMETLAQRVGPSLSSISAGGGLPTPYRDGDSELDVDRYFDLWDAMRNRLADTFGHAVSLELEPGRYPVAESGFLLTEIRAIKEMGENLFYLVDAGFNNLARPILYGAFHPMAVCAVSPASSANVNVVVGGPLCESGDIFTQTDGGVVQKRVLPKAQVGDILVIGCAGAYGFVMSSNYNSKPLAAEVLVDEGNERLIRRRQTEEEIFQLEEQLA
ncbi:MAG: diaminopimelate decarboxylase [Pirellulaceae bacterium]